VIETVTHVFAYRPGDTRRETPAICLRIDCEEEVLELREQPGK
jgi:hypothetical protein